MIRKLFEHGDRLFGALLTGRRRIVFIAVIFITGSICCGIYSVVLGPVNDWDMKNYQYYSAYSLLTGRYNLDYAPAQIQTFLNPLPFVPFYLLTTHFMPVVAGFIIGGIHGLAAGFLFLIAMTLFSSIVPMERVILSLSCAALGIYGPAFLAFLGGSSSDNMVSLFVLAGVYILIRAIRLHGAPDKRKSRPALMIGGALVGVAAGLKLVCIVFLIGYGIAVLVTSRRFRSRLTATGLFGIAGVLGILLSRGYWMAFLFSRYGSPLFPFYNKIFQSPYYYNSNFADTRFIPRTVGEAVLLPLHLITDSHFTRIAHGFRDTRYALAFMLLLLCLFLLAAGLVIKRLHRPIPIVRPPDRTEMFLLVFFVASYVIWQMKFAIVRYAVPLELLAPILIAVLSRQFLLWYDLRPIVTVLAFTAILVIMQPCGVPRQNWSSAYINVEVPQFDKPGETLVIIADNPPWSYLIPAFQPEVRFVGFHNNFSHLDYKHQHLATKEMFDMIQSHNGPTYILTGHHLIYSTMRRIKPYNIIQTSEKCLPIKTSHEKTKLCLWPVKSMGGL